MRKNAMQCETCIHNNICSKKKAYMEILSKIREIVDENFVNDFAVILDCKYFQKSALIDRREV